MITFKDFSVAEYFPGGYPCRSLKIVLSDESGNDWGMVFHVRPGAAASDIANSLRKMAGKIDALDTGADGADTPSLFLIETNHVGCGPVQAFAWAVNEDHALKLYVARNPSGPKPARVTKLLDINSPSFCTETDDCGWDSDDVAENVK